MNEKLQKGLSSLENLIAIQRDCVDEGDHSGPYMKGLLNGLIISHSVFTGEKPDFYNPVRKIMKTSIRHKALRKKHD
jgi:hypothetical protein